MAFLPLVLLGVDVELLAFLDGRALDCLPSGAVDAAEEHVDVVLLDEFGSLDLGHAVGRRAVLEAQFNLPAQQTTLGIDVVDDHAGHIGVGDTHDRQRTRLVRHDTDLDGRLAHDPISLVGGLDGNSPARWHVPLTAERRAIIRLLRRWGNAIRRARLLCQHHSHARLASSSAVYTVRIMAPNSGDVASLGLASELGIALWTRQAGPS
jgi:hypothetical protein